MEKITCPNPKCAMELMPPADATGSFRCPFCSTTVELYHEYVEYVEIEPIEPIPLPEPSRKTLLLAGTGIALAVAIALVLIFALASDKPPAPSPTPSNAEALLPSQEPSPTPTESIAPSLPAETEEPEETEPPPTPTPSATPKPQPTPDETPEPTPTVDQVSPEIAAMIEEAKGRADAEEYSLALQILNSALKKAVNDLETQKLSAFIDLYTRLQKRQKALIEAVRAINDGKYLAAYCLFTEAKHLVKKEFTPEQTLMMADSARKMIASNFETEFGIEAAAIPGGKFKMGSSAYSADEAPLHDVELSPYWISKSETTNAQLKIAIDGKAFRAPSTVDIGTTSWEDGKYKPFTDNHPAVGISWTRALQYCEWMTEREIAAYRLPSFMKFTLPTEAQWEFSAGGADRMLFPWGSGDSAVFGVLGKFGLYGVEPVKQRKSGSFGLFDTAGNAAEWCMDWYAPYLGDSVKDPTGPSDGKEKVIRGGSYLADPVGCRITARYHCQPQFRASYIGFRIAVVITDMQAYQRAAGIEQ